MNMDKDVLGDPQMSDYMALVVDIMKSDAFNTLNAFLNAALGQLYLGSENRGSASPHFSSNATQFSDSASEIKPYNGSHVYVLVPADKVNIFGGPKELIFNQTTPMANLANGGRDPSNGGQYYTGYPNETIANRSSDPSNGGQYYTAYPNETMANGTSDPSNGGQYYTGYPNETMANSTSDPSNEGQYYTGYPKDNSHQSKEDDDTFPEAVDSSFFTTSTERKNASSSGSLFFNPGSE